MGTWNKEKRKENTLKKRNSRATPQVVDTRKRKLRIRATGVLTELTSAKQKNGVQAIY